MKINVFDKIDFYYKNKNKKEFLYTVLAIVLAVGFISFYFIVPKISSFENKNEKKMHKTQILFKQNFIMFNSLKARNIRMHNEIQILKKRIIALNRETIFYSQLINLLDFNQINKARWAEFVKNSIIDAKKEGLDVKLVKNKYNENQSAKKDKLSNKFIVKKFDFGLNLEGKYTKFIDYMYKYENKKLLIRVNDFKIAAPNKYYIEFSLYGYKR